MGGAYGEWTYRAPPGSSRTSGGTALPPATPVGQIYTMYIDFPLDGNTLNPTVQALGRHTHILSDLLGGPPGGVLAPSCSKSAGKCLEAGGPAGNRPKSGPQSAGGSLEALGGPCPGPLGPCKAPGSPYPQNLALEGPERPSPWSPAGPWRPLEAPVGSLGRSKKTISSRWELRA